MYVEVSITIQGLHLTIFITMNNLKNLEKQTDTRFDSSRCIHVHVCMHLKMVYYFHYKKINLLFILFYSYSRPSKAL